MVDKEYRRFFVLLGQCEREMSAFVASLVPNWADADEIIQETRIRLWEQFSQYDESRDFGAWARTIARYGVLTYRERLGRESRRFSDDLVERLAETAAREAPHASLRGEALSDCLEALSSDERDLIRRRYDGDESIAEIAEQAGQTPGSLHQRMHRLRTVLYECIERKVQQEERE